MCELCQNPLHFSAEDNDSSTLGLPIIGPVQNAPVELSLAQIITQLQTQWGGSEEGFVHSWVPTTLTYSLPDQYPTSFGDVPSEASGLVIMSAVQKDAARLSFELWDDLIATSLSESVGDRNANITFNYSSATGGGTYAASSYFLTTPVREMAAVQIWANSGWSTHDQDADMFLGGYGLQTYLHEIGHALGLSHAGTYDAGNGSPISYANNAEYTLDNRKYTIMSYFGYYNTTTNVWEQDGSPGSGRYSSTPMLHDVAAIQAKYGADMSTRAGDTVYGFNSTADRDVFNFNINTNPIITIWDGGGIDTLDVSGFSQAQRIDLNAGTYSDIGAYRQNVAIAFGATIENATGGSGNDTITGNAAANTLIGGAGFDRMNGGEGDDFIFYDAADDLANVLGGNGTDTLVFSGAVPTSFNLTSHEFERAEVRNTDTGGAPWTRETIGYNASWQNSTVETFWDDGTRTFRTNELGSEAWTYKIDFYAVSGLRTQTFYTYDNNTSLRQGYDAAGRLDWMQEFRNADGTNLAIYTDWDQIPGSGNSWATQVTTYATDGATRTQSFYTYDNGTSLRQGYDAQGRLDWMQEFRNADGTNIAYYTEFDQADQFAWYRYVDTYNGTGTAVLSRTYYDALGNPM